MLQIILLYRIVVNLCVVLMNVCIASAIRMFCPIDRSLFPYSNNSAFRGSNSESSVNKIRLCATYLGQSKMKWDGSSWTDPHEHMGLSSHVDWNVSDTSTYCNPISFLHDVCHTRGPLLHTKVFFEVAWSVFSCSLKVYNVGELRTSIGSLAQWRERMIWHNTVG